MPLYICSKLLHLPLLHLLLFLHCCMMYWSLWRFCSLTRFLLFIVVTCQRYFWCCNLKGCNLATGHLVLPTRGCSNVCWADKTISTLLTCSFMLNNVELALDSSDGVASSLVMLMKCSSTYAVTASSLHRLLYLSMSMTFKKSADKWWGLTWVLYSCSSDSVCNWVSSWVPAWPKILGMPAKMDHVPNWLMK